MAPHKNIPHTQKHKGLNDYHNIPHTQKHKDLYDSQRHSANTQKNRGYMQLHIINYDHENSALLSNLIVN